MVGQSRSLGQSSSLGPDIISRVPRILVLQPHRRRSGPFYRPGIAPGTLKDSSCPSPLAPDTLKGSPRSSPLAHALNTSQAPDANP